MQLCTHTHTHLPYCLPGCLIARLTMTSFTGAFRSTGEWPTLQLHTHTHTHTQTHKEQSTNSQTGAETTLPDYYCIHIYIYIYNTVCEKLKHLFLQYNNLYFQNNIVILCTKIYALRHVLLANDTRIHVNISCKLSVVNIL